MARAGGNFLSTAAGTAVGLGLGTSITGFFLASGQKYLALSRVIAQVGQRFRSASEDVSRFGGELGYTIGQSAAFTEAMGEQSNTMDRGAFRRQVGMARFAGADPAGTLRGLGTIERAGGRKLSDDDLAAQMGTAIAVGMEEGRFGEFLQTSAQMNMQMLQASGGADAGVISGLQRTVADIFGNELGKGQMGASFTGRLQGVMTQGGPMRAFMQRAIGYGSEGSDMGYIEMRKRLEKGVYDPQNLVDMFGAFQKRGLGKGGMFKALESVSGGALKAHEIDALVDVMGHPGAIDRFKADMDKGEEFNRDRFVNTLSDEQRSRFEKEGMFGLGQATISVGEGKEVEMEAAQMKVGRVVAHAMVDMQGALLNTAGMLEKIIGVDWEGMILGLTGAIENATAIANKGWGMTDFVKKGGIVGAVKEDMDDAAKHLAAFQFGGPELLLEYMSGRAMKRAVPEFYDPNNYSPEARMLLGRGNGGTP
jgi:hypothetical protein